PTGMGRNGRDGPPSCFEPLDWRVGRSCSCRLSGYGTSHLYSAAKASAWLASGAPARPVGRPLAGRLSKNETKCRADYTIVVVEQWPVGAAALESVGQLERQPSRRLPRKRGLCRAQRIPPRCLRERSRIEAGIVVVLVRYFE